jgi:predicted signal transduction protein with EAL and GGDEF domain
MRHADQAMYLAKQRGKNRYQLFDVANDAAIHSHHDDLKHFRHALDNNELVLHYQPKVNMRTGQVTGAEALIRWQHPKRGLLPPGVFLPIVENHPLASTWANGSSRRHWHRSATGRHRAWGFM